MANDLDRIRAIKSFPSLIKYLRDDLGWEFETDDVEELIFEYEPEELGLDAKTAVKIREIKQLRPLVTNQPWGIFYINFEPKRLPVVVLRRILRSLVIKKRASANRGSQAAWKLHDLLFISSYGESDERAITFAHFSDISEVGDLPTLKVLGWDAQDTVLHLEDAHRTLREKLRFPDDPSDVEAWREQWSSAFTLRHREVVTTSIELAKRLAELATLIRERANGVLAVESEKGAFRRLHEAFKEALIHDLSADDFADMYAQTIAYGLLSARVSRPAGLVADNLVDMVPSTNPFLKELLGTFLKIGGRDTSRANRKANAIDFDELGINEVVELLRRANMEAVLRDFGNRNPTEDPVIHFYELFLKEYDPVKRMKRGVFYTPRPVVSFIVRSVDEMLRREFKLEYGLADTTTWREMTERHEGLQIPEGVSPDTPFVQVLDPATGTSTFIVETIDLIYNTMVEKWRGERRSEREIRELWNDYVPKHLLPRVYGFELMMAPYAIAHMKVGLKLYETGYSFLSSERARIYLTNTLEEPKDFSSYFAQMAPALAHEAAEANAIKRHTPITIVLGNPPYSNFGMLNKNDWVSRILEDYKKGLNERKINLDDDFIKFMRTGQWYIDRTGIGILAFITNNTYIDGITHRRMRASLKNSLPLISILDLHGSSKKKEKNPAGGGEENVFDIQQGVAIGLFVKTSRTRNAAVIRLANLWGERKHKYDWLLSNSLSSTSWADVISTEPYHFFVPRGDDYKAEYEFGKALPAVFSHFNSAIQTKKDSLTIHFDRKSLENVLRDVKSKEPSRLRIDYDLGTDGRDWSVALAKQDVVQNKGQVIPIQYKPFDFRWTYFTGKTKGFLAYPRADVTAHFLQSNIALASVRQIAGVPDLCEIYVTRCAMTDRSMYSTHGTPYLFPLYLYNDNANGNLFTAQKKLPSPRRANLSAPFIGTFASNTKLSFLPDGCGDLVETFAPEDVLHYIYAILHSPAYRSRYAEFLKIDFPRVPLTTDRALFRTLCHLGANLVALHLLEDDYAAASWNTGSRGKAGDEEIQLADTNPLAADVVRFHDAGSEQVAKGFPKYDGGKVHINPASYFGGVSEAVWNFHIGGYQVAHKWLKDRRERMLSSEDTTHYTRVCHALAATVEHMSLVDEVIEAHGGFPLVGSQDAAPVAKEAASSLPFD